MTAAVGAGAADSTGSRRLVVVGNGMAGIGCVEQILKYEPDFRITVFGDETHVNYNRVPTIKREPVWFPYRKATYGTMSRIMRVLMRSGSPVRKMIDLL